MRNERGFTMVEMLVVLSIMGILTGIGVVALSGARSSGTEKACATDVSTMRAAAEAYYAKTNPSSVYANEYGLRADGLLGQLSSMHDLTVGATTSAATAATNAEASTQTGAAFVIKVQSASCGTVGSVVG